MSKTWSYPPDPPEDVPVFDDVEDISDAEWNDTYGNYLEERFEDDLVRRDSDENR